MHLFEMDICEQKCFYFVGGYISVVFLWIFFELKKIIKLKNRKRIIVKKKQNRRKMREKIEERIDEEGSYVVECKKCDTCTGYRSKGKNGKCDICGCKAKKHVSFS